MRTLFSLALLVVACGTPVSSAQTPPVQPAIPLPPGAAQPAINVRCEFRRMSSDDCAHKVMGILAGKEDFIFAEIGKDSSAWGYNETTIVRAYALPFKDGVNLFLVCCGKEKQETERLCNAIWKHLLEAPLDPLAPKTHKAKDANRKPCGLCLRSSFEQRNTIPTVRLFVPAAVIVMEKNGLGANPVGPGLILGGHQASQSFVAVIGAQGPNEANTNIGAVAISPDENEAERLHNVIRAGIAKVLFE